MTLDADGDDAVTLRVDCGEAALAPAMTLMDVIELMGVPVRALCLGQVGQGAVGVVAVCSHRSALPSTRFSLSEPTTQLQAHVRNVTQWAELRAAERERFCARVGAATGQDPAAVEHDLQRGRFFGADEALAYGLLDEVARPDAPVRQLPGHGPAAHGVPPSALTRDRDGPACLRCGDDRDRAPPPPARRRRMGRRPDPCPGELARRHGRADAHLHDVGPGRPRAVPALAGLRRRAARGQPARPAARAGHSAHRRPLRRPLRVGPAPRAGGAAGRDARRAGGGERGRRGDRGGGVGPAWSGRPCAPWTRPRTKAR